MSSNNNTRYSLASTPAPKRMRVMEEPNYNDEEFFSDSPLRHYSAADDGAKIGFGGTGPLSSQQGSGIVAQGLVPNPGEGDQRASSSTSAEGVNATRKATKQRHLSEEEKREKNRVKAKENRLKTKRNHASTEEQVRTLNSEKECLQQKIDHLQLENAYLQSQIQDMVSINDQSAILMLENVELKAQIKVYEKMFNPEMMFAHDQKVIIISEPSQ